MPKEEVAGTLLEKCRLVLGRRRTISYKFWLMRIFLSADPYSCILETLDSWDREETIADLLGAFTRCGEPLVGPEVTDTFHDGNFLDDAIREPRYLQAIASILSVDGRLESAISFARASLEKIKEVGSPPSRVPDSPSPSSHPSLQLRADPQSGFWGRRGDYAEIELAFCRRRAVITLLDLELAIRERSFELRTWSVLSESLIYDARHSEVVRLPRSYRKLLGNRGVPRKDTLGIKALLGRGRGFSIVYLEMAVAVVRVRAASSVALGERTSGILELQDLWDYVYTRYLDVATAPLRERRFEMTLRRQCCLVRRSLWDLGVTDREWFYGFTDNDWYYRRLMSITIDYLCFAGTFDSKRVARQDLLRVSEAAADEIGQWMNQAQEPTVAPDEDRERMAKRALGLLEKLFPPGESHPVEFERGGLVSRVLFLSARRHLLADNLREYLRLCLHSRLLLLCWGRPTDEGKPDNLRNLLGSLLTGSRHLETSSPCWRKRFALRNLSSKLSLLYDCLIGDLLPAVEGNNSLASLVRRSVRYNLETHFRHLDVLVNSSEMGVCLEQYRGTSD